MGRVKDTKFSKSVSNKKLLNAVKYQCYSFYHFWVIKGKQTGGWWLNYSPPWLGLNQVSETLRPQLFTLRLIFQISRLMLQPIDSKDSLFPSSRLYIESNCTKQYSQNFHSLLDFDSHRHFPLNPLHCLFFFLRFKSNCSWPLIMIDKKSEKLCKTYSFSNWWWFIRRKSFLQSKKCFFIHPL